MWEKQYNVTLPPVLWGMQGEGNFWLTFEFEIFYSGTEVSVAHSKVTVTSLTFRHSPVAP
jgi:hypothetical protein